MRRTKEEAEQTRQEIIKAAIDVFSEKGFAASTLVDIANKANVTRGAIYWHFKNKNDLFIALIDENKSKINNIIQKIREDEKDPLLGLKKGIIEILKQLDVDPEYRAIENLLMKNKFAGEIDFVEDRFEKSDFEGVCIMREIFEEHKELNNRPDFDINTIIKAMGSFVYGAMILKLNTKPGTPFHIDSNCDALIEVIFKGIENI